MRHALFFVLSQALKHPACLTKDTTKENTQGFTLIELLVVIIIIGILAVVAIPTFIGQINRAQQAGAKVHIGAFNRAQQAYYFERGQFASTLDLLETSVQRETPYHTYDVGVAAENWSIIRATPKGGGVQGYVGLVYVDNSGLTTEICDGSQGSLPNLTITQTGGNISVSGCIRMY